MDGDLISRSALIARIIKDRDEVVTDNHHAIGLHNGLNLAHAMAVNATAVDAVRVVQCHECVYNSTCNRIVEIMPRQEGYGSVCGYLHYCEYGVRRVDDGK